jgi:hypothetical protein
MEVAGCFRPAQTLVCSMSICCCFFLFSRLSCHARAVCMAISIVL